MTLKLDMDMDALVRADKNMPTATRTHVPVAHATVVETIIERARLGLPDDWTLRNTSYTLANDGQVGIFKFHYGHPSFNDMGAMIAAINAHNKSRRLRVGGGAHVWVCLNGQVGAEFQEMRKHTTNIYDDFVPLIDSVVSKTLDGFRSHRRDALAFHRVPVDTDQAASLLGRAFMNDIVNTSQANIVKREWKKPSHEEFEARNLWSLYNAFTEALKTAHPATADLQYTGLHNLARGVANLRDQDFVA